MHHTMYRALRSAQHYIPRHTPFFPRITRQTTQKTLMTYPQTRYFSAAPLIVTTSCQRAKILTPSPFSVAHPHTLISPTFRISTRSFFWSKKPQIQGTITPQMKRTQKVFRTIRLIIFLGLTTFGAMLWAVTYFCDHLEKLMQINIKWRGQGDIHYYATEERVHHKFNPLYTGDKVADIKLLQTKLIRDIYKAHLALSPMGNNIDTINKTLSDKKVEGLREMAAEDPELAAEITEDVILEAQYGISLSPSILAALQQQLFRYYSTITQFSPSHSQNVDTLHDNFLRLKMLEDEMVPLNEYVDACLDALVESSVTQSHYKNRDSVSMRLSQPNIR